MSAIAGILQKPLRPNCREIVKKMCDYQIPRGPDGEAYFHNGDVCLGYRHLKLGGEGSGEPKHNLLVKNDFLITADVNIYNAEELQDDFIGKNYAYSTKQGAGLILHLYGKYGVACLNYLRGDFAFGLWDGNSRKFYLVRDRFGIKPLFYFFSESSGRLVFASELKALLCSGLVDRTIDHEAIYHFLFLTFVPQPLTPFKEIKTVLPGTYLEFDIDRTQIKQLEYWDIPCVNRKEAYGEREVIEECGRLMRESVALRCPENDSIGISLSSGMDSCSIAAMLHATAGSLKTFTFGFQKKYETLNEFNLARIMANSIHSSHFETTITGQDIHDHLSLLASHLGTPTTGMILPMFFAKRASQEGIKVAFRGDGGNSAFQFLIDDKMPQLDKLMSWLELIPGGIDPRIIDRVDSFLSNLNGSGKVTNKKLNGVIGLLSRYFSFRAGTTNFARMFTREERRNLFADSCWNPGDDFKDTNDVVLNYFKGASKNILERYTYGDFKVYYDQGVTHLGSLFGGFAIDVRLPFFDHNLIEFIMRAVPQSLREKGGVDKYILKAISKDVLPNEIINRNASGFYAPMGDWLKGPIKPIVDDVFSKASVDRRGIFKSSEIKKIYENYFSKNTISSWRKIWAFVVCEYWFRSLDNF